MTTGQRVAQKRKELGLSQEALGERLGVSRQSIYKWESDSALPEIEKLVALSRLFGVPVGWLLGVEEETAPAGQELTEAQLKMVEEIAARYAPKPRLSPGRLAAVKIAAAAAALCLCGVLYGFSRQLDGLRQNYDQLQSSISQVQSGVNGQIGSISNRVEQVLKAQNDITASCGVSLVDVDPSASSAFFQVYAVPKQYVEGMRAEFYEANGTRSRVFDGKEEPGQRFTADLKCGLLEELTLSVTFIYPDDTRQTQVLDSFYGLYGQTFPLANASYSLERREVRDGSVIFSDDGSQAGREYGALTGWTDTAPASNADVPTAEVETVRVGLFKNKKLVDWAFFNPTPGVIEEKTNVLTGEQWALWDSLQENLTFGFQAQEVPLEPGDTLQIATVVRDVYGRTAVRAGTAWGLDVHNNGNGLMLLEPGAQEVYPGGWMLPDGSPVSSYIAP